jgi:protein TonB
MWKNGTVVCRARSGETAPPLGASLSADSGISGECLRTGEILHCGDTQSDVRVDPEVCGRLGLRSMAIVPIVGWHGINGILEVFSTQPRAFTEEHIAWLKQLATLAEKARALQPHTASTVVEKGLDSFPFDPQTSSDRLRDVVLALIDSRWRPLVLASAGVLVLLLVGLVIWLGFHTPDGSDAKVATVQKAPLGATLARPADDERVWKSNPGGESLLHAKPSPGTSVNLASKLDRIPEPKTPPVVASFTGDATPEAVVRHEIPASPVVEASMEPPSLAFDPPTSSALSGVLATPVATPGLAVPISQGVSNGYLVHRVSPVYPSQALLTRMQGVVVLEAVISEDGTVENLKAVEGPPILASAALQAVKQWRYKPYELNGKPVRVSTNITVNFKLP